MVIRGTLYSGIFVTVLLLQLLLPASSLAQYSILADTVQEVYSFESRIPVTQANMVLQTRDGYLWIASYDGLVRYDGIHSKIFDEAGDGFPTRSIMTLFEDAQERLWVGSNNAGLALYDKQKGFRFFGIGEGLPSNSVRKIVQDRQGTVYVATSPGLAAISPDFGVSKLSLPGFGSLFIADMFVSTRDELWCVLNDGGILVLKDGAVIRQFDPQFFADTTPRAAFQASDGAIYLGFTDNKAVVMGAGGAFKVFDTGPQQFINSFYEDSLGRVWVCADTGMGFFDSGRYYSIDGALLDSSIKNMTMDFEGNLWFASARKGLLQVMKSKFSNVSMSSLLPPLVVNATHSYQDHLYIGHDRGLVILGPDGQPVTTELTKFLNGIRVRSIEQDGEGNIWIATYSTHGLVRYSTEQGIKTFNVKDQGLSSNTVRCVYAGREGKILVGTVQGVSVIRNGKVERNYAKKDGLLNPIIMNLYEDGEGRIYAGSDGGGIYIIDGDTVTAITEADGLPSGIIMRLRHDPVLDGLWVSTENGVCFWDGESVRTFTKLGGYGINIFDIQFAGDDAVWLMGSGGIFIAGRDNLFSDEPLKMDVLHERDGLRNPLTANSWHYRSGDNTLYLCTNEGVLSIEMDAVYKKTIPPRLIISRVTVDDKKYDHPEELAVPADASRVTIDFSLISFTYPTGNSVTFFMKGFDKEPNTLSTDYTSSASYTNLSGGDHVFIISGSNKEGVASKEIIFPIHKMTHITERPIFHILLGCAILGFFAACSILYSRYKTRAILARKQEYRVITEQAVTAIADTIDAKDEYTSGHSKRVADFSLLIAKRLGLSDREQEDLYYTALLHDIGKVGLEDNILNKPGELTREEYFKMQQHVVTGADILMSITVIEDIATGALYHHERFDGQGYCSGLSGKTIPLFARIICVADAFDAMCTTRAYRERQTEDYVMEELDKGRNTQFDGDISDIMIELVRGGEISVKGPRVVTPWVFQDADEGASSVYPAPGIAARESGA